MTPIIGQHPQHRNRMPSRWWCPDIWDNVPSDRCDHHHHSQLQHRPFRRLDIITATADHSGEIIIFASAKIRIIRVVIIRKYPKDDVFFVLWLFGIILQSVPSSPSSYLLARWSSLSRTFWCNYFSFGLSIQAVLSFWLTINLFSSSMIWIQLQVHKFLLTNGWKRWWKRMKEGREREGEK